MDVNQFGTMHEALAALRARGYTEDFIIEERGMHSSGRDEVISPQDVTITEYHRFEGSSNPDDMAVIYALEHRDGRKGTVVDAYGTYANPHADRFLKAARMREGLS